MPLCLFSMQVLGVEARGVYMLGVRCTDRPTSLAPLSQLRELGPPWIQSRTEIGTLGRRLCCAFLLEMRA